MRLIDNVKMNKTVFEVGRLDDPSDDWRFWLARPAAERFKTIEILRQISYGYDPSTTRLQRVSAFVEQA